MEFREFRAEGVETDDTGKLRGLVTPFDRETTIGDMKRGGWKETVKPGCFTKTLREADYLLVYQHDLAKPMARRSAGNLTFQPGELDGQRGLLMDASPVDTSYTRDCMALVRARVVNGMSFGFNTKKDAWYDDDGNPSDKYNGTRRELLEVELVEGSPVTRPAYGGTAISARDESNALLEARQRAAEERGPKPYGNVHYADPKNGKYPIDTVQHVRAAWSYINMPKNAAKYPLNGVTLKSVKSKIKAAMAKYGIKVSAGRAADPVPDHYDDDFYIKEDAADRGAGDAVETRIKKGTAKRVVQMDAELGQAMELLSQCDASKLPKEAQDAMALISSAKTHAGHVVKKEKLGAGDTARAAQEPDTSTPDDEDDFALTVAIAQATYSRDLGSV